MAETGHPHRIRRGRITQLGGEDLRHFSDTGRHLGGVVLDGIIDDDNVHERMGTMVLPVIAELEDGSLVVPTWQVAAALSEIGQKEGNREVRWLGMQLGSDPESALVVPAERVAQREPL